MAPANIVVHMIGNAHLDPVWLWRWPSGFWEAIATCRTACDLLDEYPDFHYTRGEAWVHNVVAEHDPATFERVKRHVSGGRWHLVNGWWVQPDANLPSEITFDKQAEIGQGWFERAFGRRADVGYSVDAFGHCAMMPAFLRRAGLDCYTFQRPCPEEKTLPAELFRWEAPTGEWVTAARILPGYTAWTTESMPRVVDAALAGALPGVGHVMAWYGVGDHGGGPTRSQLDWIREHLRYAPGVELRMSHPRAFFDAVAASGVELPVVRGELQYHAIGCYTAVHDLKQQYRRAENLLEQAAVAARLHPAEAGKDAPARLDEAWRRVLFNSFHDTLDGTAVASACEDARDELGAAKAAARDIVVSTTTRLVVALPPHERQRLVLHNLSDADFDGYLEFEPTPPPGEDGAKARLLDEQGRVVPLQRLARECASSGGVGRFLFRAAVPAGGGRTLAIDYTGNAGVVPAGGAAALSPHLTGALAQVWRGDGRRLRVDGLGPRAWTHGPWSYFGEQGPHFIVLEDNSDTWAHGIDRFDGRELGRFEADLPWAERENGPLCTTLYNALHWGHSRITLSLTLRRDDPALRMRVLVDWRERNRLLKLVIPPPPGGWALRRDGTPGGLIDRPFDNREYPFHNSSLLSGGGLSLGVVSADVYGVDAQAEGALRLTLLRSPVYAHHDPLVLPPTHPYPATDQGTHVYDVALLALDGPDDGAVAAEARRAACPVWISETTAGMPWRNAAD